MYDAGLPIGGGIVGGGVLAATGFDTVGLVLVAVSALIGGLLVLRIVAMRRRRADDETTASGTASDAFSAGTSAASTGDHA